MSFKTDARDGGRGEPLTKMMAEGYKRRYQDTRREYKNPAATRLTKITFSRLTKDLKGHIYDVGTGSQAYQFTTTTKAPASYSRRKCTNPQDIRYPLSIRWA